MPSALHVLSLMDGGGDLQKKAAAWRGISFHTCHWCTAQMHCSFNH